MTIAPPTHDAWTHTSRGRALDLLHPSPEDVDIEEAARALGNLCRYAGGVSEFYSVAEHSVLISEWLLYTTGDPYIALAGLLHDVAEAYTGDMTWPMQVAVFGMADGGDAAHERYREVQAGIESAILTSAGLPLDLIEWMHSPAVKSADKRILVDERARLLAPGPDWNLGMLPLGVHLECWGPMMAGDNWMDAYRTLLVRAGLR